MIITKIEIQKKNKDRASVYIDDEFAFGLHINVVYDLSLKKGMEIDQDFIDRVLKKEEAKQAQIYALKLINYRPRCVAEVRRKMAEKEYPEEIIDETIEYLLSYGFLDDAHFAKLYIESKLDINKYGINRIRYQLLHLGVDRNLIDSCIDEIQSSGSVNEYETALAQGRKKMKLLENDSREAQYRKLTAFLGRKGYDYDTVYRVARELLNYEE